MTAIGRILLPRRRILARVRRLAAEIAAAHGQRELVVVPVLTGAFMFLADLVRCWPRKLRVDVVVVTSYAGRMTGRRPRVLLPNALSVAGRQVLIVDDILQSGRSLAAVQRLLRRRGAASVRTCVLLRKAAARRAGLAADFIGFDIPDEFVVGYGMDYRHHYRNLPDIAVLNRSA